MEKIYKKSLKHIEIQIVLIDNTENNICKMKIKRTFDRSLSDSENKEIQALTRTMLGNKANSYYLWCSTSTDTIETKDLKKVFEVLEEIDRFLEEKENKLRAYVVAVESELISLGFEECS